MLDFSPCVFSNASSNRLPVWMQSHIDCIYLTFLQCVFSNVSSNHLPEKMQSHIGCICLTFLFFLNVSSMYLDQSRHNCIGCIGLVFPRCAFSSASSSFLFDTVHTCNGCICLCVSKWALKFLGPDMQNHILRICENFPYFVYSDVHLNVMHARLHTHTVCIFLLFFAMYFWGSE